MKTQTPGRIAWRSVMRDLDGYRSSRLLDARVTLRAALDLARKASETYPETPVHVFEGKRVGMLIATFKHGACTYFAGESKAQETPIPS